MVNSKQKNQLTVYPDKKLTNKTKDERKMAKKAMMNKEARRMELAAKGKYPKVRLHNRCSICGRPHGFHRDFGLCRIHLREMAHRGLLPGVVKASW